MSIPVTFIWEFPPPPKHGPIFVEISTNPLDWSPYISLKKYLRSKYFPFSDHFIRFSSRFLLIIYCYRKEKIIVDRSWDLKD